jgi:outer membrane protein TolC
MRISQFKKGLFTLIAFFIFAFANCQQQADSLVQYLEIASKNNPSIQQKYSEYQSALQKVVQAGSLNDPELSVGIFLSPMELISGNQIADIRLMQMFPWFGVLKNAKDEMSLMAMARFETFLDAKFQAWYDVQSTWYEMFKIKEEIRISEENLELLHSIERVSLAKFKATPTTGNSNSSTGGNASETGSQNSSGSSGMQIMGGNSAKNPSASSVSAGNMKSNSMGSSSRGSGLTDLYRVQIEIGDLENNIALLKNKLKSATARFNSYLNRPAKSVVFLPDNLVQDSLVIPLSAISDSIEKNNPMLEMLKYEQQSLEAKKNMVSRMSYPMVGIGVNYSVINRSDMSVSPMNGKDMIMPMVTVTLPVYRKKYKAMINESEFLKASTVQAYQAASNSLQNEYYEAVQLYEDAKRRIDLYEIQSQLAKNTLSITIKSFSVSGSELADVLKIRQQSLDYEIKKLEALSDYNTSIAWLKRLMADNQIQ